ncbi:MAG: hypothetical protein WD063_01615 [Pirellulales bacterium]
MQVRGFILVVVCALSLAAASTLSGANGQEDQGKAALEKRLQELLKERVKTAERARDAMQASFEAETVTLINLVDATNKLVEARLAVATTPAQEIDALEKHLELMQNTERKIKVRYDIGTRGGEAKEYATAQRERQSAEIALTQARLKTKR